MNVWTLRNEGRTCLRVASVSSCESRGVHEAEGMEGKDKISKGGWM